MEIDSWRWDVFVRSLERLEWTDIGIAVAIFSVFLLFRKIFTKYIFKLVLATFRKTPTELFTNILLSFEKPLRAFWIVLGTYLALVYLPFHFTTIEFVEHLYRSIIIILIGWGLYNYTSEYSMGLIKLARNVDIDEHSMLVPFVSKILRFAIIALIIVVVASEWGYEISGFIAGLGLGGLAFALAAQDTIGNFFGGVIIITEKPFSKGDWIQTPSVEGVVEDINFRSTQIRTFSDSIVTIPNSTLANEPITNWSEMGKRRVSFSLGVTYSTPKDKVERCARRIESVLRSHDEVDQDLIMVRFSEFNNSSLDIFVYFFTKTIVWAEWFRIKEEINFEILKILEEENVSVAFPSRSIYMENNEVTTENMQTMMKESSSES
ncbi:mechanosensitive ion channel family protein [Alkalihalobacillus sp. MEB130]|uniref:mechanosensitive ion channel family protein n=1 Tax=Alkalihalobacillus sp. MEB130 TaxID=2976704 RepID=UPI0028DE9F06|nr:mechanosensitive ion channel family protein [Alkalihalobacillus sp. MEB130]MDT8859211.1 mechanosensitive ion channel family protein [Alkalihalobacillus sp. MEB130]